MKSSSSVNIHFCHWMSCEGAPHIHCLHLPCSSHLFLSLLEWTQNMFCSWVTPPPFVVSLPFLDWQSLLSLNAAISSSREKMVDCWALLWGRQKHHMDKAHSQNVPRLTPVEPGAFLCGVWTFPPCLKTLDWGELLQGLRVNESLYVSVSCDELINNIWVYSLPLPCCPFSTDTVPALVPGLELCFELFNRLRPQKTSSRVAPVFWSRNQLRQRLEVHLSFSFYVRETRF